MGALTYSVIPAPGTLGTRKDSVVMVFMEKWVEDTALHNLLPHLYDNLQGFSAFITLETGEDSVI